MVNLIQVRSEFQHVKGGIYTTIKASPAVCRKKGILGEHLFVSLKHVSNYQNVYMLNGSDDFRGIPLWNCGITDVQFREEKTKFYKTVLFNI